MSQIAFAFALPSSVMTEAQRRLSVGDQQGFLQGLRPFEVGAGFPYSGYVVVVLVEYLRESGLELPISRDPDVRTLIEQCDPLACAGQPDAAAAAEALAAVGATGAELARYWQDFTGDQTLDAATAMRTALDWLRQAFAAGQASDWCIILEG
jgi:hypothetical protein